MLDKLIKKLEKEGRIRKQKVGVVQVEGLLRQAMLKGTVLFNSNFSKNKEVDP